MENIIAALNTLVVAAAAIRRLDSPGKTWHLNNLVSISTDLIKSLETEVMNAIAPATIGSMELTQEEKNLILKNQFIKAIKSYRARTGWGLKESKDKCDDYRRENMFMGSNGEWVSNY